MKKPALMIVLMGTLILAAMSSHAFCSNESSPQKTSAVFTDNKEVPRDYRERESLNPVNPAIFTGDSVEWEVLEGGMRRKVYFCDRLTMVLLQIDRAVKPDEKLQCHYHAHDQITYVLEGSIKVKVGSETKEIGPGGCYIVPSNVHHGLVTLTQKVRIMDVFTPVREDFRP